jgi:hypothetical protein
MLNFAKQQDGMSSVVRKYQTTEKNGTLYQTMINDLLSEYVSQHRSKVTL